MGERDWQSSEFDRHDRLAGIKHALARIFGDGENPLAWGFRLGALGTTPIKIHLLFVVYLLVELIFTLPGNRSRSPRALVHAITNRNLTVPAEPDHAPSARAAPVLDHAGLAIVAH